MRRTARLRENKGVWGFALLVIGLLSLMPRKSLGSATLGGSHGKVPLRIVTYNLWGLPGALLQKPKRMGLIERELPKLGADILILNEAFHAKTRPIALLKEYPYRTFGPGKSGVNISSGVVLLSRYPILKEARVKYSQCAGMDCLSNKGAVYAQIQVPDVGPVQVIGTHLNADGRDSLRSRQLEEAFDLYSPEEDSGPMVLAGDLNFHSESGPYSDLVVQAQFRDVHAEYRALHGALASIPWFGFTYDPNRNKNLQWLKPFVRAERLDYIWIKDSACVDLAVRESKMAFDRPIDGVHLSDHFGVLADIDLTMDQGARCVGGL
jgi:endonuclease/exonuclease/phosphatase family metal-dependent hydrolase